MKFSAAVLFLLVASCGRSTDQSSPANAFKGSRGSEVSAIPSSVQSFEFHFSNFQPSRPEAVPPKAGGVHVKVVKYDPQFGKVEWSGNHRVGDRIGWGWESAKGRVTSVHRVYSPVKRNGADVDFDSTSVIKEITTDKSVAYQYKTCEPWLVGFQPDCPGPVVKTSIRKVNEVIYVDGIGYSHHVQEEIGLRGFDSLCVLHGGIGEPGDYSEKDRNVRRSREAVSILRQADYDWGSRNPKTRRHGQNAYQKLLEAFSSETIVEKNRDRIKARSEAEIDE